MKHRAYTNSSGGVSVVTFSKDAMRSNENEEQFMHRVWSKLRFLDQDIPEKFIDVEEGNLPEFVDSEGVSIRSTWRIKGKRIIVDETVRNIHREIYDDEKAVEAIESKKNLLTEDVVELRRLEGNIKKLQRELKNVNK